MLFFLISKCSKFFNTIISSIFNNSVLLQINFLILTVFLRFHNFEIGLCEIVIFSRLINDSTNSTMRDVLVQLKNRPTFQEQWPDRWEQGLKRGKDRILKLEQIRTQQVTMTDILSRRPEVLEWWIKIA